ncbi:MAG: hypothetical protein J07AB43_02550 [Candidatus Nanosalina sp. J07AB43]|jgi:hypothetical protein|nr:MAG: hypothetical protein J07AB43_02550 [Candidatus Nanosalina sp. J07AB43]
MNVVKHNIRKKAPKFTDKQLDEEEYYFTLKGSDIDVRLPMLLERWGYRYQMISSRKLHPLTAEPDFGSWRRVPDEHPDIKIN